MVVNIIGDRFSQRSDIGKCAAAQSFVGHLAKPSLDHIEPRTRRRGKMQMEAWVAFQPGSYTRMLMGSVVVDDQMQLQIGGHFGINAFQKANEFLVSVTGHAIADHSSVEHIESSKERSRTVSFIVVCLTGRQSRA